MPGDRCNRFTEALQVLYIFFVIMYTVYQLEEHNKRNRKRSSAVDSSTLLSDGDVHLQRRTHLLVNDVLTRINKLIPGKIP